MRGWLWNTWSMKRGGCHVNFETLPFSIFYHGLADRWASYLGILSTFLVVFWKMKYLWTNGILSKKYERSYGLYVSHSSACDQKCDQLVWTQDNNQKKREFHEIGRPMLSISSSWQVGHCAQHVRRSRFGKTSHNPDWWEVCCTSVKYSKRSGVRLKPCGELWW